MVVEVHPKLVSVQLLLDCPGSGCVVAVLEAGGALGACIEAEVRGVAVTGYKVEEAIK